MSNKKETIYLETSVISAYFDFWQAAPTQKRITHKFWKEVLPGYQGLISDAVMAELSSTKEDWAKKFRVLVSRFTVLPINKEITILSEKYVKSGIIPKSHKADALHLSIACMNKCDYLATWNSQHLVRPFKSHQIYNFNKKHKIHFPILVKPEYFLNN